MKTPRARYLFPKGTRTDGAAQNHSARIPESLCDLEGRAPIRLPRSLRDRLEDALGDLLGVAEQHHGVVAAEQLIVDTGLAR